MSKYLDMLFANKPLWVVVLAGLVLLAIIGFVDYRSGYEVSYFVFFAIPITLVTWYAGRVYGCFFVLLATLVWGYVNQVHGQAYSQQWIFYWNAAVRLVFFLLAAYWVSNIKLSLALQRKLARTDNLTGCLNGFAFNEKCDTLLPLSRRFSQPIALGFIDVDDFKRINDTRGHSEGDRFLKAVADTMMKSLRSTDIVGRLGGDEFSFLLPNTDIDQARVVVEHLRQHLADKVRLDGWPVSFSMGVVVFHGQAIDTDRAIGMADALMYRVKKSGKNNVIYEVASMPAAAQQLAQEKP